MATRRDAIKYNRLRYSTKMNLNEELNKQKNLMEFGSEWSLIGGGGSHSRDHKGGTHSNIKSYDKKPVAPDRPELLAWANEYDAVMYIAPNQYLYTLYLLSKDAQNVFNMRIGSENIITNRDMTYEMVIKMINNHNLLLHTVQAKPSPLPASPSINPPSNTKKKLPYISFIINKYTFNVIGNTKQARYIIDKMFAYRRSRGEGVPIEELDSTIKQLRAIGLKFPLPVVTEPQDKTKLTEEISRQKVLMQIHESDFDNDLYQNQKTITINNITYHFSQLKYSEHNVFIIETDEHGEIGRATLSEDESYLVNIRISDTYRRKGLATKLYEYIESVTHKSLNPSPIKQPPEIKKFWDKKQNNIQENDDSVAGYQTFYHQTDQASTAKIMKHGFNTPEVWAAPDEQGNYGDTYIIVYAPQPQKPFIMDIYQLLEDTKLPYEEAQQLIKQNQHLYQKLGGEANPETFNKLREMGYDEIIEDNGDRCFLYPDRLKYEFGRVDSDYEEN